MNDEFERVDFPSYKHAAVFYEMVGTSTERTVSFIKLALSEEQFNLFDWSTAKSKKSLMIRTEDDGDHYVPMVSVRLRQHKGKCRFALHLEHEDYNESKLMMRLFRYQAIHYMTSQDPLVSIVVYHGPRPGWKELPDFQQFVSKATDESKQTLTKDFGESLLNFRPLLLNLPELVDSGKKVDNNIDAMVYIFTEIWDMDLDKLQVMFDKVKLI